MVPMALSILRAGLAGVIGLATKSAWHLSARYFAVLALLPAVPAIAIRFAPVRGKLRIAELSLSWPRWSTRPRE